MLLLLEAREVFYNVTNQDDISRNPVITAYAEYGLAVEALECLKEMKLERYAPDVVALAGCSVCTTMQGMKLRVQVEQQGLLRSHEISKCGLLTTAQDERVCPNAVTFVCSLKACSTLGAFKRCKELHIEIGRRELLEKYHVVGNNVVCMYANCGLLATARQVFEKLLVRDVVSRTVLMTSHACLGQSGNVFRFYDEMIREGVKPNLVTFVVVLMTCNQTVLYDKILVQKGRCNQISKEVGRVHEGLFAQDVVSCKRTILENANRKICQHQGLLEVNARPVRMQRSKRTGESDVLLKVGFIASLERDTIQVTKQRCFEISHKDINLGDQEESKDTGNFGSEKG